MSNYVCSEAIVKCSAGITPATLTGSNKLKLGGKSILLESNKSIIGTFGTCNLKPPINGVPQPCTYTGVSWTGTKGNVMLNGKKMLLNSSTLKCAIGGSISILNPMNIIFKEA